MGSLSYDSDDRPVARVALIAVLLIIAVLLGIAVLSWQRGVVRPRSVSACSVDVDRVAAELARIRRECFVEPPVSGSSVVAGSPGERR